MNSSSTWEKFQQATVTLARSGSIKDRLSDAYRNHLAQVGEDELPRELRQDFRAFSHALTREQPALRGEDPVRATVRKLSSEEAEGLAFTVVQMFSALPRSMPAAGRGKSAAQVVPLYIAEA